MGGTGIGQVPEKKQRKEIANSKNWQIMEYSGNIVLVGQIPSGRAFSGYVGRLLASEKNGSLRIKLAPYINSYSRIGVNTGIRDVLYAEATGIVKSDDPRAVKRSLKLRIRDIGKKISIERLVK